MNVDEMVTYLRTQRDELREGVEEQRAIRSHANGRIKSINVELVRIERLLRAAEGRKGRNNGDGGSQ